MFLILAEPDDPLADCVQTTLEVPLDHLSGVALRWLAAARLSDGLLQRLRG